MKSMEDLTALMITRGGDKNVFHTDMELSDYLPALICAKKLNLIQHYIRDDEFIVEFSSADKHTIADMGLFPLINIIAYSNGCERDDEVAYASFTVHPYFQAVKHWIMEHVPTIVLR